MDTPREKGVRATLGTGERGSAPPAPRVEAVMTVDPVRVEPDTPLDEALERMEQGGFRHLPVVEGERLVALVSDRDLLEATGWLPRRVHAQRGPFATEDVPCTVGEVASASVVTVGPGDPLDQACALLVRRSIGCVPVVDADALIGIVTETDLLRSFVQGDWSAPALADTTVGERMTPEPTTIQWCTSLAEAVAICHEQGILHLPVLEAGELIGIVTDRDLRRAIGSGRRSGDAIDEHMTTDVVTAVAETPLVDAARTLALRRIGGLPVVRGEELVGIVTIFDVLRACLAARGANG